MNFCYLFFIIISDIDVKCFYWMENHAGDLQSAWYNGPDIKTIISTNATSQNWDFDINEDFIFYTSYKNIMKIHKSLGQNPTVLHSDTQSVYGLLF